MIAIPAGMKPWGPESPGYPSAPADWDGGPYLCRDGKMYHMNGYGWEHGLGCWNPQADWDRIAYTAIDAPKDLAVEGRTVAGFGGNAISITAI